MIYIDHQIEQLDLQATLATVSEQRRAHVLCYRNAHDQRLSLAAYRLLQRALSEEYGILEPPLFDYGPGGKPTLVGHPGIHFSLSHCHEAAACVVATNPVGIDVESLSNYDADIVKVAMSDEERRQIATSSNPRLTFMRLWTMKESLLKWSGEGISEDLCHVLTENPAVQEGAVYFTTTIYPQFVCTVCNEFS